jgi:hypothetical protein
VLLIVAGWFMAKTDFFDKIRSKLIPKLLSNLYSEKNIKPNQKIIVPQNVKDDSYQFDCVDPNP